MTWRVNLARSKDAQKQIGANVLKRATNNFQRISRIFARFTILKCEKFIKVNTIFRLAAISLLRIKRKIKKYIFHTRVFCEKRLSNAMYYIRMMSLQAAGLLVQSLQQLSVIALIEFKFGVDNQGSRPGFKDRVSREKRYFWTVRKWLLHLSFFSRDQ